MRILCFIFNNKYPNGDKIRLVPDNLKYIHQKKKVVSFCLGRVFASIIVSIIKCFQCEIVVNMYKSEIQILSNFHNFHFPSEQFTNTFYVQIHFSNWG